MDDNIFKSLDVDFEKLEVWIPIKRQLKMMLDSSSLRIIYINSGKE